MLKKIIIDDATKEIHLTVDGTPVETTFKTLDLKENDIEEFLRKNIGDIVDDEDLLIVGKQVSDTQNGRSDLTAVDGNGNLVIIEIKRDKDDAKTRKEPLEWQAIRYAASITKIKTPDILVNEVYKEYIEKYESFEKRERTANEEAIRRLNEFLEKNESLKTFNRKQRIILIASEFEDRTLSSIAWLISNNVDIVCYEITPVKIGADTFVDVKKVLPPLELEDYFSEVKGKKNSGKIGCGSSSNGIKRKNLPRMPKLFEWGIIKSGDSLEIKGKGGSEAIVENTTSVKFKNEIMSFNNWGKKITGWSSMCIYDWAVKSDSGKTLGELREEKVLEMETSDEE